MTDVELLKKWLNGLEGNCSVGIDEGGLVLEAYDEDDKYVDGYEVGGIPEEIENQ